MTDSRSARSEAAERYAARTRERAAAQARPRRRKPSAKPVVAGSLAAFMGLFGFMTYQLAAGHDPALGAKAATAVAPAPKRVLVKRIEHHIVVTKLLPPKEEEGGDDGQPTVVAAAPSAPAASAPVAAAPAPTRTVVVQQAPAPAPAPAAPVVTRSS